MVDDMVSYTARRDGVSASYQGSGEVQRHEGGVENNFGMVNLNETIRSQSSQCRLQVSLPRSRTAAQMRGSEAIGDVYPLLYCPADNCMPRSMVPLHALIPLTGIAISTTIARPGRDRDPHLNSHPTYLAASSLLFQPIRAFPETRMSSKPNRLI